VVLKHIPKVTLHNLLRKLIQCHQRRLVNSSMYHSSSCNIINIRFQCYSNYELKVIRNTEGHGSQTNTILGYKHRINVQMSDSSNLNPCGMT